MEVFIGTTTTKENQFFIVLKEHDEQTKRLANASCTCPLISHGPLKVFCVHLWVRIGSISIMHNTLALNCLVSGDNTDHIFTIEIANAKNVSALKDSIKDKKKPAFDHVPADTLVLWKVSLSVDKSLAEIVKNFDGGEPLSPLDKLSKVFSVVDETCLHIVVGQPPGACKRHFFCCIPS